MMLSLCYDTPSATGTAIKIKTAERFMWSQRSANVKTTACLCNNTNPVGAPVLSKRREGSRVQRSAFFQLMGFLINEPCGSIRSQRGSVIQHLDALQFQELLPGVNGNSQRGVLRHKCLDLYFGKPDICLFQLRFSFVLSKNQACGVSFSGSSLQPETLASPRDIPRCHGSTFTV